MKNLFKNSKAFTLIELLIVIAILGILVALVVIAINPVKLINDARDGRIRSDMQQIKASMQLYYNECKDYPSSLPASGSQFGNNNPVTVPTCDDNTVYMRQMPDVPGRVYTRVNSSSYRITADLSTVVANRSADDSATLTKCNEPTTNSPTIDYAVCND